MRALSCETCGIPRGISKGNVWRTDGSISGRFPPYIKGTFLDVEEINHLFRSLSDFLGFDIGGIVAGGKYHDAKEYMSALVEKMKESSGGKPPPPEEFYRMMLHPVFIWGIAEVRFVSIRPEKMVIEVKDPYSVPLLCGDVAAVADVVEGGEHRAEWDGDDQEGIMTVLPGVAFAQVGGRVEEETAVEVQPLTEELPCEACEECGAPRAVSELFRWEAGRCVITERGTGRRYCYNNSKGISAVLKLLVSELGEELDREMVDISRAYSCALYGGLAGGFELEKELGSFPYRGWGRVREIASGTGELAVAVENPYNETLVVGRIWGMGEASRGCSLLLEEKTVEANVLRLAFKPS